LLSVTGSVAGWIGTFVTLESYPRFAIGSVQNRLFPFRSQLEASIETSLFAFAIDLVDGGVGAVLDDISDRAGVGGVSLATAYHHARDVFPHNPVRKVYYHEGGTIFFVPELSRYGRIVPQPSSLTRERDILGELCAATAARSMSTTAWTVYLHNTRLSTGHPEHAPANAFGDRYLTDLCPADPAVREYAVALTSDICRYPVSAILAESLHFKTIDHGYHHERSFVDMGPTARFLLGLCFCEACTKNAYREGIDAEGVRRGVSDYLLDVFSRGGGGHDPLRLDVLDDVVAEEMGGYLGSRSNAVSRLVEDVANVARTAGVRFTFSAHGGSAKGSTLRSSDAPGDAWVLGVDLPRVAAAADDFEVLGYVPSAVDLQRLASGYLEKISPGAFAVGLRPMWPDTTSSEDLTQKVRIARSLGARRVDFYHYGLMPSSSLDWIGAALAS
jgi:hypothetical protein